LNRQAAAYWIHAGAGMTTVVGAAPRHMFGDIISAETGG
jgi:hypothetical protein